MKTASKLFVVGQRALEWGRDEPTKPTDAAERERALDIEGSWIVEAPAGSGKTGLLIQRYLKLLAEESVEQPGQVVAITFTKKAAAEIRERVVGQLESAEQAETGKETNFEVETRALALAVREKDRRLGWGLLESPQRMNVKTIDSLCAQIVGSTPVLSGGGAGMAPVEDAAPLYQAAARRTMMLLGGNDAALNDALREVLLHRDGNLAECERLLAEMLGRRQQWGELIPLGVAELSEEYLDETVLPKLQRTLERVVCAGLTELAESVPGDFLEELAALASSLAGNAPYKRDVSPIAVCAGRDVPGTEAGDLEHWRALIHLMVVPSEWTWRKGLGKNILKFETTREESAQLRRVLERISHRDDLLEAMRRVDKLPPAVYPEEQWRVAKALFRLLSRALVELQLVFAERGECDFAEFELLARGTLRQDGGVVDLQEALGLEQRHLLVDEMQDTSTSQYELIELLTQGWDGRSQTVFLVGDPKQSIYLFRQARVERFVRTMEEQRLGDLAVKRVRLTANFRSQRRLVETFNEDFALVFPGGRTSGDEVQYQGVEAERATGHSMVGVEWHTRVMEARRNSPEEKRERRRWLKDESQMVRKIAQDWRARPLPEGRSEPWKIAVLVQTRRHLSEIVAALKEEGDGGAVPYCAVKIDELAERQEVMDLFALTRALLHPADRVAWLAVLRAPWCGLSLADLHKVAGGDDPLMAERCIAELMVERESLLSEEGRVRLARVRLVMQAAEAQRGRLTNAEWVERTWRSLGGDVSLTAAEFENARRYLLLLDEAETGSGGLDVTGLQRRMTKLYAETVPSAGAVDLMTIHGAKGLEWDVVMVPGLARRAGSSRGGLLVWNEVEEDGREAAHGMLAPIAGRGEPAKELNQWMKRLRDAREEAERKRLFYVACTRAKEELHLFAAPSRKVNGEIVREQSSLLKAAWAAAERQFEGAVGRLGIPLPFEVAGEEGDEQVFAIAASGGREIDAKAPTVQRLPIGFDPAARFRAARRLVDAGREESEMGAHFERPEGSFAARAFGNAVHGFLDLLARRMREGAVAESLSAEVAGWGVRAEAVLRGEGLPPAMVKREAQRVLGALQTALADDEGRWVLGAREGAASEYAFTTWAEVRRSFRLDRVFVAGVAPMAVGSDCLWIVDYKTADHGLGVGVDVFLEGERLKYGAQMESYARGMAEVAEGRELRVGLYYPLLPKLVWWRPGG